MKARRPTRGLAANVAAAATAIGTAGLALASCITPSSGQPPPLESFYYPTGLAVSPGRTALFVANSDFDLQFNGGSVLALDLRKIRKKLIVGDDGKGGIRGSLESAAGLDQKGLHAEADAQRCGDLAPNFNRLLSPAPCQALDASAYVTNSATIGAFASGAVIVRRPGGVAGARLFVPVRGDPSLTYFDITDDTDPSHPFNPCVDGKGPFCLDCGQAGLQDRRCADAHRVGQSPVDNTRGIVLPVEPLGVDSAALGDGNVLVVAHQTQGAASLVTNPWEKTEQWLPGDHPALQFTLSGLPDGPTDVATVPEPALVTASKTAGAAAAVAYEQGFLVSFRASAEVDLVRYHADQGDLRRPFLTRAGGAGITALAKGTDSRGIALDASERRACEAACTANPSADVTACLTACVSVPLRFFIANRSPASLLIGRVETVLTTDDPSGKGQSTAAYDKVSVYEAVPLTYGASHVALGHVIDHDGKPSLRVFAVAFDSRFVFSYDPESRRVDQVIRTGRGPHAIAFDTGDDGDGMHSFLLVGHFTDSYVGVVDLDMRHPHTFGSMFASLGQPLPPKESK
jgi:hypothetical protein